MNTWFVSKNWNANTDEMKTNEMKSKKTNEKKVAAELIEITCMFVGEIQIYE